MPKKHIFQKASRQNLVNASGNVEDAPTTTYLLLAQHFEDGKQSEWLQEVELSLDEYDKLRRYLAEIRGLIPAKSGRGVVALVRESLQDTRKGGEA